jgi:hypothetical protein
MPLTFKRLVLFLSITAAFAADKETPFRPAPAGSFEHHLVNQQVTIGVDTYHTPDKAKLAFGKVNPYDYGVLPVLVVIQNDSSQTIKLDRLKSEYVGPNRERVDATPASQVRFLKPPERPSAIPGPVGQIKALKSKKNPLAEWEIEGRALSAQLLPPGQTASGFLYFQTGLQGGSTIYLNGLTEAQSGKELLFFEIPLK